MLHIVGSHLLHILKPCFERVVEYFNFKDKCFLDCPSFHRGLNPVFLRFRVGSSILPIIGVYNNVSINDVIMMASYYQMARLTAQRVAKLPPSFTINSRVYCNALVVT